ncbi:MAG: ATP-binding cassette domain-containing protein [Desulfobacterales bacterium]
MPQKGKLLEVKDLKKYFPIFRGVFGRVVGQVKAVDGIDLVLNEGECLALVGESGCGKTTAGRTILRLLEPSGGEILFHSSLKFNGAASSSPVNVTHASAGVLKHLRREMQIIYQDPYSSLNARMTVGALIEEPLLVNRIDDRPARTERVRNLLHAVGLDADHAGRYPHQFSGGQRQRIAIARALALSPRLIVADEPISALDVSVQAQVLTLLKDLQQQFSLTYLFITHDLSVVKFISHRVAVMYLGRIVESADTSELFDHPQHPYTEALISAVPVPDPDYAGRRILLPGDVPTPIDPPAACHFHPRCLYVENRCRRETPILRELTAGHQVRCHRAEELSLQSLPKIGNTGEHEHART